jgi:putative AbiEii toxin of type IV toxin-antitoxin system/AAA domain-containing protein
VSITGQGSHSVEPFAGFQHLSAGARFLRADLHIHTYGVSADVDDPEANVEGVLATARERGLDLIAVTDHNAIDSVESLLEAASENGPAALAGVELTTGEGHVLVYFPVESLDEFKGWFARLRFEDAATGGRHTLVPIRELLKEVNGAGGIAVPAHVSRSNTGFLQRVSSTIEESILLSPYLHAVEVDQGSEGNWYSDLDRGEGSERRRELATRRSGELGDGVGSHLAKLLFSDAHHLDQIGRDRQGNERVTRIKMSAPSFAAFRTALSDPDARVKLEADLPQSYPRIEGVRLIGGFLDGQEVGLSPNLTCLIGGRGTGKSTLLESLRCTCLSSPSKMDGEPNCPETVQLVYRDGYGVRHYLKRDDARKTYELTDESAVEISVPVEGYDQDRIAAITRGYRDQPRLLLDFLDQFVELEEVNTQIELGLAALIQNSEATAPLRTAPKRLTEANKELSELKLKLKAIETSNLKEALQWRRALYSERRAREELEARLSEIEETIQSLELGVDLRDLTRAAGINDPAKTPGAEILLGADGTGGLIESVEALDRQLASWKSDGTADLANAVAELGAAIAGWQAREHEIEGRVQAVVDQLRAQNIDPNLAEMTRLSTAESRTMKEISDLEHAVKELGRLSKTRRDLLADYRSQQQRRFHLRTAALQNLTDELNDAFEEFKVKLAVREGELIDDYAEWLATAISGRFMRKERVASLCRSLAPAELARLAREDKTADLAALEETPGSPYLATEEEAGEFALKLREADLDALEQIAPDDRPEISLTTMIAGAPAKVDFGNLSLGQKASILLGALLFSSDQSPLLIDQPEDHLDSQFIARTVVGVLRRVKEKRQVIVATHNANIAILGDAEQIIPLQGYEGRGLIRDPGSVDADGTRARACEVLEGGEAAYRRRGEMYGLEVGKR